MDELKTDIDPIKKLWMRLVYQGFVNLARSGQKLDINTLDFSSVLFGIDLAFTRMLEEIVGLSQEQVTLLSWTVLDDASKARHEEVELYKQALVKNTNATPA